MTFSTEQIASLNAPLDSKVVKKPTGQFGPKGDYIEAWHAINEANRIFGFDGWSYRIALTKDSLVEGTTAKGDKQWQAAYTCVCTLTVGDTVREDVGFGSGFAKGIGDAIEGATKEAATDALKRCLRTFGNPFGLALYDKARANVVDVAPEPSNQLRDLIAEMDNHQTTGALKQWLDQKGKVARARLSEDEQINFNAAYTNYKAGLTQMASMN